MRSWIVLVLVIAALGCEKKPEPTTPPSGWSPEASSSDEDLAAAQGTWTILKVEQIGLHEMTEESRLRFTLTLNGKRVTTESGHSEHGLIELDATATPKRADLHATGPDFVPTQPKPDRPVELFAGIYRFDGATLVIAAATEPGGPRPTEFKAKAPEGTGKLRSGVIVVYLTKKKG